MTASIPMLFNIFAETSPVKAPLSEKCIFCAITSIFESNSKSLAIDKLVNEGAIITDTST